jgi:dTMP kinase
MYAVQFLASCASLFWTPAKDASVPNLVPPDKLEQANQYSLLGTFGPAPIAGLFFGLFALFSRSLGSISPYFSTDQGQVKLALYFNAATFVVSAITIYLLREIPKRQVSEHISAPSVAKTIWEGWKFIGRTKVVRGIVIGMIGAFSAGGVVVGLGPSYIKNTLEGGSAGWGITFAAVFGGLATGMFLGLRILRGFSRRRLFGLSIAGAGVPLVLIGLIPSLVVTVLLVILLGAFAGIAYVTGYTIVGSEVDDATRGRTFAFLQSGIRVILFAVIAIAPFLAGAFTALVSGATGASTLRVGHVGYNAIGYNLVLILAAVVAVWLGVVSYRQMDDRRGVPLRDDLSAAVRGGQFAPVPGHPNGQARPAAGGGGAHRGLLIAFEGGEGAGKTTQARLLAIWLREQGYDVVATQEPGATKVGMRLRALLLDTAHTGMSSRAETLMYAADRAEHVDTLIRPALERGAVVVTDRFVDSSLAYQGRGRNLPIAEVAGLNQWATGGLRPDLTILLDLPPMAGLVRRAPSADRLEAEPAEFHQRVREGFLAQARAEPRRYLVLDATRPADELSREIQDRIHDMLPDPVPAASEDNTGAIPVIVE